ncbi:MAG: putative enoyl-CoA hydratase echA8 [Acidimicrobiales bacterium]|nr:MAG: hypothetical protein EDR02_11595 [Actinomycetota bacterium]MBV6508047.1 putative enoyl-CoA hydratase echA8 [Acidimicrobiales bacterium]RIK05325.1 MAG: hypothetical protein DCC48_10635 [Acidobacteriota bacterium]
MQTLEYREEDTTAVVTLHRPDAMNAITEEMLGELRQLCSDLAGRADLRAVVIAGSDDIFCAGADLKDQAPRLADLAPSEMWVKLSETVETFNAIAALPHPTIAAISGFALGGGLELALSCDLRVASPSAKLGLPEAKVGMMPAAGGTQRLPRIVGASRAAELMFTGNIIDSECARSMGLVNVVDHDWLGAAMGLAERIARCSPVAIRLIKDAMWNGLEAGLEAGLRMEAVAVGLLFSTDDRREGLQAFLDKRAPQWQGS